MMTSLELILVFFMRRRSRRHAVDVPRNEEDATRYSNAGTRSAR